MNEAMTFSKWYEFNCLSTKHPIFQKGISTKVNIFSHYSYNKDDMIFSGLITLENLNLLFGAYNVFNIRSSIYAEKEFEHNALEIFLFPPQSEENQPEKISIKA